MARIILFNKPFGVLSQFSDPRGRPTLAAHIDAPGMYPAGRLDLTSEGLLLLTDNGQLQARIAQPRHKLLKHYWVQVEGTADRAALEQLRGGVMLNDGPSRAVHARRIEPPAALWPRHPPVRQRQHIPTDWLELAIDEGRNRQVRRMTAAVGLPTLRLIRWRIGNWTLGSLQPGAFRIETVHPATGRRPGR